MNGSFIAVQADSFVFDVFGGPARAAMPIAAIDQVERWEGERGHSLLGFAFGAGAGFVAGAAATAGPDVANTGSGFPIFGCIAIGAMVGTLIGATIKTDVWEPVRLPTELGSLGARPPGPAVGLVIVRF